MLHILEHMHIKSDIRNYKFMIMYLEYNLIQIKY